MSKLLLVLGAGASKEVNLPVGAGLKDEIARALNFYVEGFGKMKSGDPEIYEALQIHCQAANIRHFSVFARAARRIAANMPLAISIDNFLDAHRGKKEVELCGKFAIVRQILVAERASKLHCSRNTVERYPPHC